MTASFLSAVPMLALGLLALGLVVYCEVDVVHAGEVRHLPKWLWAVVCLVSIPVGCILYLAFGRSTASRA